MRRYKWGYFMSTIVTFNIQAKTDIENRVAVLGRKDLDIFLKKLLREGKGTPTSNQERINIILAFTAIGDPEYASMLLKRTIRTIDIRTSKDAEYCAKLAYSVLTDKLLKRLNRDPGALHEAAQKFRQTEEITGVGIPKEEHRRIIQALPPQDLNVTKFLAYLKAAKRKIDRTVAEAVYEETLVNAKINATLFDNLLEFRELVGFPPSERTINRCISEIDKYFSFAHIARMFRILAGERGLNEDLALQSRELPAIPKIIMKIETGKSLDPDEASSLILFAGEYKKKSPDNLKYLEAHQDAINSALAGHAE
jgi:hypothetical protein